MVVKIYSEETHHFADILNSVGRVLGNSHLIEIQLAQIKIKIVKDIF